MNLGPTTSRLHTGCPCVWVAAQNAVFVLHRFHMSIWKVSALLDTCIYYDQWDTVLAQTCEDGVEFPIHRCQKTWRNWGSAAKRVL